MKIFIFYLLTTLSTLAQCVPVQINPVPNPFRAHIGTPVDYTATLNRLCSGKTILFSKISGPPEFNLDTAGGLFYYTPTNSGTFSATIKVTEYTVYPTEIFGEDTETFDFIVDNNRMSYPIFRDYRNETNTINIVGNAPDCLSWQLQWYKKAVPGTRYDITTPQSPVANFTVPWDISTISNGQHTVLVMKLIQSDNTNEILNSVIIDRTVKWSKRIAPITHSVVAANISGDNKDEFIVGDHFGAVWCFDYLGNQLWKTTNFGVAYCGVSTSSNRIGFATTAKLYMLNTSGGIVWQKSPPVNHEFRSTPTFADITGDGIDEILVGFRGTTTSYNGGFRVYNWNGTIRFTKFFTHWSNYSSPSVSNLDGVDGPEIVTCDQNKLYIYSSTGTLITSVTLPRPIINAVVNGGGSFVATVKPAIGGGMIVVGPNVFNSSGTLLWYSTNALASVSASLADLDGDSNLEVIMGGYTYRSDGSVFPKPVVEGLSPAVIGSYGGGELIISAGSRLTYFQNAGGWNQGITGYEVDGTVQTNYPKSLFGETGDVGSPQVGDFDKDGLVDVAVAITDASYGGVVVIYNWPDAFDTYQPWPMFGHDVKQSGNFE